jgi:hypothetical protein
MIPTNSHQHLIQNIPYIPSLITFKGLLSELFIQHTPTFYLTSLGVLHLLNINFQALSTHHLMCRSLFKLHLVWLSFAFAFLSTRLLPICYLHNTKHVPIFITHDSLPTLMYVSLIRLINCLHIDQHSPLTSIITHPTLLFPKISPTSSLHTTRTHNNIHYSIQTPSSVNPLICKYPTTYKTYPTYPWPIHSLRPKRTFTSKLP